MTSKDNANTFGERLRLLRSEKNLNQAGFGEILGDVMHTKRVSSSAIGAYERNEREPTYEMLKEMASFFNVSIDYLLCNSDERLTVDNYIKQDTFELDELLTKYKITLKSSEITSEQSRRILDIATAIIMSDNNA